MRGRLPVPLLDERSAALAGLLPLIGAATEPEPVPSANTRGLAAT